MTLVVMTLVVPGFFNVSGWMTAALWARPSSGLKGWLRAANLHAC